MRELLTFIALATAASGTQSGESTEYPCGTYVSLEPRLPLRFSIGWQGADSLEAFGEKYHAKDITIEFLAAFGSSKLVQLRFVDRRGSKNYLSLLMLVEDNRVRLVSGYFVRYKHSKGRESVIDKARAAEFSFDPCPTKADVSDRCTQSATTW